MNSCGESVEDQTGGRKVDSKDYAQELSKQIRMLLLIGLRPLLSFSEFCCILVLSWKSKQGQVQMKHFCGRNLSIIYSPYCGMVIEHDFQGS